MDTIFAPICPLGGSVVSVRFSGLDAFNILNFFSVSKDLYLKKNLFFTKLIHNNKTFDEVVVKIFHEPSSFTGENVVEIDLHASRVILQEFLRLAAMIPNFRFAKNGEFSRRAFLNGKIDLIKSEGINALIKAETMQQKRLACLMFSGDLYEKYNKIREKLLRALSLVEVNIDFSEEDVPKNVVDDIENITNCLINELTICLSDKKVIDKINNGILIAIIGKPNVGKSTLLNWLAKREVAIVSPIAGTTRDVLSVDLDLDGYKVTVYDTAGIHESSDLIELEGIRRAKDVEKNADLCIYMFDDIISDGERKRIQSSKNALIVINKSDLRIEDNKKNNKSDFFTENDKENNKRDNSNDELEISILQNKNLDLLMQKIKSKVSECVKLNYDPMVLNERHNILLLQSVEALKNIDFNQMPIEIIGEELRIACDRIGQIVGTVYTEDILDSIFSKFCIGK